MSNLYDAFLSLIPTKPTLFGVVVSVSGEQHEIELIGGGLVICTSQKPYGIGSKVFVSGEKIESEAPDNFTATFYV